MKKLEITETKKIIGGSLSVWAWFAIGSAIAFVAGVIDGIARPLKCH